VVRIKGYLEEKNINIGKGTSGMIQLLRPRYTSGSIMVRAREENSGLVHRKKPRAPLKEVI
jgi:hypothetical protein